MTRKLGQFSYVHKKFKRDNSDILTKMGKNLLFSNSTLEGNLKIPQPILQLEYVSWKTQNGENLKNPLTFLNPDILKNYKNSRS